MPVVPMIPLLTTMVPLLHYGQQSVSGDGRSMLPNLYLDREPRITHCPQFFADFSDTSSGSFPQKRRNDLPSPPLFKTVTFLQKAYF